MLYSILPFHKHVKKPHLVEPVLPHRRVLGQNRSLLVVEVDDLHLEEPGDVVERGEEDGADEQVLLAHLGRGQRAADGAVALQGHGQRQVGRAHAPDVDQAVGVGCQG